MTLAELHGFQKSNDQLTLTVMNVSPEAEGVVSLELGTEGGRLLPDWEPGAHIDVVLPGGLVRQYSLCGDPDYRARWKIGVLLEPSGRGGSKFILSQIHPGDEILVAGPRNNFGLIDASHYLFIAGGIGITPILPMVRQIATAGLSWTLLYGGRTRASMAFVQEVLELPGGQVHVVPQNEYGHPDLQRFLGVYQPGTVVYCCGPGPLIDAVEAKCQTWPPAALHRERFAPSANKAPVDDAAFEVELAHSGRRITVPADRALLDVLEDAGCEIANSCRAGICGTCLVRVIAGTPEHNDDLLDDAQRASGSLILPCVSRSKSKLLVLDL